MGRDPGRKTLTLLSPAAAFSHNFSLYAFPIILKPGTGYPMHSTLTNQHQKKSFFTDLSALPLFAFSMLSMAVFSLRPRGLSTSKKTNQNK